MAAAAVSALPAPRFDRRLVVLTHVEHWPSPAGPLAYEPYVREMRVWADLFREVAVLAPRAHGALTGQRTAYERDNLRWHPLDYPMGTGVRRQLARLARMPGLARRSGQLVRGADLVLLRSPGHPALIGRLVARAMRRPMLTKWAGLFESFPGERLPSRIERRMVARGPEPALVYGRSDASHLISFPPALMSTAELDRARALGAGRDWRPPWQLLSVGRLDYVKGFDLALAGLAELHTRRPDLAWHYTLVGDGPAYTALAAQASASGIGARVTFAGAMEFAAAQECYALAHIVLMPGVKEGWPKPIAEAWAHGAVPVAAAAGIIPWILERPDSGWSFQSDAAGLATTLTTALDDPARLAAMGSSGFEAAARLSLEAFARRAGDVVATILGCE